MSTRPSRLFTVLLALGFVLGAGGAVLAQAQVTADDLNQLTWRWVGPVNFSGRISEFAVPPGQTTTYYVLAASGGVWKTEDAGTHFEPIFDKYGNMSMGSLAHRRVRSQDPLPGHGRTHARPLQLPRQRRLEIDRRREDLDERRARKELLHQQGPGRSQEPGRRLCRRRRQALRQRHGLRARLLQDDRRRQDLGAASGPSTTGASATSSSTRATSTSSSPRPTRLYRRSWTFIDRQPGNNLYKTTDGGKTWKKLDRGPARRRRGRPGRPGHLRQEPGHRLRPDRRRGQPGPGRARRRRQLPRGRRLRRRRRRRRRAVRRRVQSSTSSRPSRSTRCWPKRPPSSPRSSRPTRPSW